MYAAGLRCQEVLRRFCQNRDFSPPSEIEIAVDDLSKCWRHLSRDRLVQRIQVGSGGLVHESLTARRNSKYQLRLTFEKYEFLSLFIDLQKLHNSFYVYR